MKTSDFDYTLPPELIAQTPIEPRDASRLLVLDRASGQLTHSFFRDIGTYLRPGDLLVANESRVIPARLQARKIPTGGKIELLLVAKRDERTWETLVKGRKLVPGHELAIGHDEDQVTGRVLEITKAGGRLINFEQPIEPLLDKLGVIPLPPYIHTPLADAERYQTVYARQEGSVAAPTAGLHFTPQLLRSLQQAGVQLAFVTLDIGMDTFRPVKEEQIEEHVIHTERCEISPETAHLINQAKQENRRVIAVGTTVVRVLETAASASGIVQTFAGSTNLFIYPGFQFRVVDALITNFHLPRSTLLMLVCAFAGRELIFKAYEEAIRERYRFYSFGDAMLIL
ncbi:MAG: tRNA preQ1(34) S-adenosylmethionine ribosyltransferase-isomerase QueA [Anaerolineae bacterium]|jgi:S-adenosylmethionine:tRNA ribosyltransferase-isomerase|nr:tRNA preQ1(34) S-adenosylmethionine ribosyltransferase-isomerase QueA [Anaerolineae bacterium]MDH7472435.1 tRNA preQ1(34) S-adenosylmethionine ribosyltransferase-isomerase QueA [Anaerolineae bacterium]